MRSVYLFISAQLAGTYLRQCMLAVYLFSFVVVIGLSVSWLQTRCNLLQVR